MKELERKKNENRGGKKRREKDVLEEKKN